MKLDHLYILSKPLSPRALQLLPERKPNREFHLEVLVAGQVPAQISVGYSIRVLANNQSGVQSTVGDVSVVTARDAVETIFRARRVVVL
jgi:hypothetical protein